MKIPSTFYLDKKATALEAFRAIVSALGLTWNEEEPRLFGRASVAWKEEISFGVHCETEIEIASDVIPAGLVYRIRVSISTSGSHRTPSEARMLARMLEHAADVGAFVECVTRGRTWTGEESGLP